MSVGRLKSGEISPKICNVHQSYQQLKTSSGISHFLFAYVIHSSSPFLFFRAPLVPAAGVSSSRNGRGTNFGVVFVTVTFLVDFGFPPFPPLFETPLVLVVAFLVFLHTVTILSPCSSSSFNVLAFLLLP